MRVTINCEIRRNDGKYPLWWVPGRWLSVRVFAWWFLITMMVFRYRFARSGFSAWAYRTTSGKHDGVLLTYESGAKWPVCNALTAAAWLRRVFRQDAVAVLAGRHGHIVGDWLTPFDINAFKREPGPQDRVLFTDGP